MSTRLQCPVCRDVFTIGVSFRNVGARGPWAPGGANLGVTCPQGHFFDAAAGEAVTFSTGADGWLHIAPAVRRAIAGRDPEEIRRIREQAMRARDDRNFEVAAEIIAGLGVEGAPARRWLSSQSNRNELWQILGVIIMVLGLVVGVATYEATVHPHAQNAPETPGTAPTSAPQRPEGPAPPTTPAPTHGEDSMTPSISTPPPLPTLERSASSPPGPRLRQVLPPDHRSRSRKRNR